MNLLVFMYHRARAGRHGNPPELLDAHFAHVAKFHRNVLPGDDLAEDARNVCLTFDDGYFDFYALVFPLLQKHGLRALLAIPPGYIMEETTAPRSTRLHVSSQDAFADRSKGGFCTWGELREMAESGHVAIAAHGFTHVRLDRPTASLANEIDVPRITLEFRLPQSVESFAFPFGRYSPASLQRARQQYRHVFRIGGAANRSWRGRMLYRIDADGMAGPATLFAPSRLLRYRARHFWNVFRRR